ncbi:2127_t:CDS:2, partial [Acaulospora colombiana]
MLLSPRNSGWFWPADWFMKLTKGISPRMLLSISAFQGEEFHPLEMGKDLGIRTTKKERKAISNILWAASSVTPTSQTSHLSPTSYENNAGSPLSALEDEGALLVSP